ncbi:DUF7511 domain-containing protein [Natronorubrum tibetense]|uniref:DUF7511 domain-containing protein n=1 Tax=Natronorubrum tibetense GA33 TaxID=1114856 RepID=L9VX88_9EURY|nr:hypothetical protein [Natronorubrum tibetense]ELY41794.1 hypothetical protein C496_08366 [Natronorubrum tibetense GA33]
MSNSSRGCDDRTVRQRLEAAAIDADHVPALECVIVRYRTQADRCTITPRECPEDEQTTTWLSTDLSAVVDLDSMR